MLGSWLNYQVGVTREPTLAPPYTVIWPTLNMAGLSLLRTILGLVVIVAVKAIFKALSFATICALLQVRNREGGERERNRRPGKGRENGDRGEGWKRWGGGEGGGGGGVKNEDGGEGGR